MISATLSEFHVDLHQALCRLQGDSEAEEPPEDPSTADDRDNDAPYTASWQVDPSLLMSHPPSPPDGSAAGGSGQMSPGRAAVALTGTKGLPSMRSVPALIGNERTNVLERVNSFGSSAVIQAPESETEPRSEWTSEPAYGSRAVSPKQDASFFRIVAAGARRGDGLPLPSVSSPVERRVVSATDPTLGRGAGVSSGRWQQSSSVKSGIRTGIGGPSQVNGSSASAVSMPWAVPDPNLSGTKTQSGTRVNASSSATPAPNPAGVDRPSHTGEIPIGVASGLSPTAAGNPVFVEPASGVDDSASVASTPSAVPITDGTGTEKMLHPHDSRKNAVSAGVLNAAVTTGADEPAGYVTVLPAATPALDAAGVETAPQTGEFSVDAAPPSSSAAAWHPASVGTVTPLSESPIYEPTAPLVIPTLVPEPAETQTADGEAIGAGREISDMAAPKGSVWIGGPVRESSIPSVSSGFDDRGGESENSPAVTLDFVAETRGSAQAEPSDTSPGPRASFVDASPRIADDPQVIEHESPGAVEVFGRGERPWTAKAEVHPGKSTVSAVSTPPVAEIERPGADLSTLTEGEATPPEGAARRSEKRVISEVPERRISPEHVPETATERTVGQKEPDLRTEDAGRGDEQPAVGILSERPVTSFVDSQPRIVVHGDEGPQARERWVPELVHEIEAALAQSSDGRAVVHIRVEPASLGEVHLEVILSPDKQLQARFVTENPQVKELIERGFPHLQRRLQGSKSDVGGIVLEAVVQKGGSSRHQPSMAQALSQPASHFQSGLADGHSQNPHHRSGYVPIAGGGPILSRRPETDRQALITGGAQTTAAVDLRA